MIWAGPQSLPRSPGIGWGHGGVQQPQPYFPQPRPQPYFPQPQPRFNPYASQNPKFMPLPGPMPGPMPPPRSPGKGRSYRPPTFPSNYGQMRYTPQRFGGYGIPSSLPGILNPPIGPPPGGPGKGRRPGGPGRKGGGSPGNGGGGSPGQFPPSGPPPTQLPSPPSAQLPSPGPGSPGKRSPGSPGRKGGGGPLIRDEFDPSSVQPFQHPGGQHNIDTQAGQIGFQPGVRPHIATQPIQFSSGRPMSGTGEATAPDPSQARIQPARPGGGGMFGTLGGPGYGEFPLGTAGPRVDPSDPAYRAPPMTGQPVQFQDIRPVMQPQPIAVNQPYLPQRMRVNQQNQTNQFQPQPGSGFGMPPPPAPLTMTGDPVDVGFSSGVTVPQPTMSQAQKRAQYFQKQRMKRAGYSTGGITDLPVDRRQEGGKTGTSEGTEISNWNIGGAGRLPLNMPRSGTGRMPDDVKNYFNTFTQLSPEGIDLFLVSEKENETIEQSMDRLSRMRAANDNPDHSQYGVFGEMLYQPPFERADTSIPLQERADASFAELRSMLDNREKTNMKRLVIQDLIKDLEARRQARLDKEK